MHRAHRPIPRVLTAVGALPLLLVSCSDALGPDGGGEPITTLPRELTVVEAELIEQSNAFGLDLFGEVVARDARPNIVLSPFSASMALGMTLNGAAAGTFDAMRTTLGFEGLEQDEINAAYRALIDLLTQLDPAVRFDVANSIWANKDVAFHQAFFDAVREAFDASTESRDFASAATLAAINAWVSDNTDGLIDTILDTLDPGLVMLLINAIYFEGTWTYEFDPDDTARAPFTRADGSRVDVDMMSMRNVELPLGGGQDYAAVELPYGGEAFSMLVVVPHGDARAFVAGLDARAWSDIVAGLGRSEVDLVSLPKFELSFDAYLNDALEDMGMGVAFRPGADFTRLSPIGDQLCIDFVRQKTFIDVDERGTKAAAATAVGVGTVSFTGLIVDRPFVFAIRERLSGTVIFVGLVGDPSAHDPGPEPFASECR